MEGIWSTCCHAIPGHLGKLIYLMENKGVAWIPELNPGNWKENRSMMLSVWYNSKRPSLHDQDTIMPLNYAYMSTFMTYSVWCFQYGTTQRDLVYMTKTQLCHWVTHIYLPSWPTHHFYSSVAAVKFYNMLTDFWPTIQEKLWHKCTTIGRKKEARFFFTSSQPAWL